MSVIVTNKGSEKKSNKSSEAVVETPKKEAAPKKDKKQ